MEEKNIKRYIKWGVFLVGGFFAARAVVRYMRKQTILRGIGSRNTIINDNLGNSGGFVVANQIVGFDAEPHAKALYNAMSGGGTDESLIFSTLEPLSLAQRQAVRSHFNAFYGNKGFWNWGYAPLFEWFDGDLSEPELSRAKNLFTQQPQQKQEG